MRYTTVVTIVSDSKLSQKEIANRIWDVIPDIVSIKVPPAKEQHVEEP